MTLSLADMARYDTTGDIPIGQRLIWAPSPNVFVRVPIDAHTASGVRAQVASSALAVALSRHQDMAVVVVACDGDTVAVQPASTFVQRPRTIAVVLPAGWHCLIHGDRVLADMVSVLSFVNVATGASMGTIITPEGTQPHIVRGRPAIHTPQECQAIVSADMAAVHALATVPSGLKNVC